MLEKFLLTLLWKPVQFVGVELLRFVGLRIPPDPQDKIKADRAKNKTKVLECPNCGKEMKGEKDPKSDSDDIVLFKCSNSGCGFQRDIRKEQISQKGISQYYNESQKDQLEIFETQGRWYKSKPGKLPNNNTCKAIFVSRREKPLAICPYCGEAVESLELWADKIKNTKDNKEKEAFTAEMKKLEAEFNTVRKKKRIRPSRILPFMVPKKHVVPKFKKWLRHSHLLRPGNLQKISGPDVILGVYVPLFYIEKGKTRSTWVATATGSQNVQRKPPKGEEKAPENVEEVLMQTGYLEGEFSFDGNASSGVMGDLLSRIKAINPKELVPFDPEYLNEWTYEIYQADLSRSFKNWQKKLNESLSKEAKRRVYGKVYSSIEKDGKKKEDFKVNTEVSDQKVEHIFLPMWACSYSLERKWRAFLGMPNKSYQFLINGYTGEIAGKRPISFTRLAIFYSLLFLLITTLVWMVHTFWHNG